ncbi:hypothetical protein D3C71_25880 [compost metagenome]
MYFTQRAVGRALLVLAVGAMLGTAHAAPPEPSARFKAECESKLPPARIVVTSQPSEVVYDFSRGVQELTKRSGHKDTLQTTLGLTESKFQLESQWKGEMLQDSMTRQLCTRPQIEITVKVGPQRVSIGKEFPQQSCAFWEIAKHELRHVTANQERVEFVAEEMQKELRKSFGNRVFYGSREDLSRAFSTALREQWLPWGKALYERVADVHREIDSPQEYARNRTMCDGEVVVVLAKHRNW